LLRSDEKSGSGEEEREGQEWEGKSRRLLRPKESIVKLLPISE
jgi:hypothetical protein